MEKGLYKEVVRNMPVAYALHRIIVNEDGQACNYEFMEINPAFEEATGLVASETVGKRVTEILPGIENDPFDWIKTYGAVALEGSHIVFEQYAQPIDRWYRVIAFSPQKGYFVTLVTDITKEKSDNQNLLNSNKLFKDFLNASSDFVSLKDEQFRYLFANECLAEFLGTTADEVIGKDDFELMSALAAKNCRTSDQESLCVGSKTVTEEKISDRTYEAVKFPVEIASGLTGVGSFIRDVSKCKNQEEYLKKQIERQSILVDVFMRSFQSRQEQLDYMLHRALELTESKYGFIYLYDEKSREFSLKSWTNKVMADCAITEKQTKYQLDCTGIWGEVVRQRRPIMINDFEAPDSLKKGYPQGHVAIKKYLSIPLMMDDKIIAVIGVANKKTDYNGIDLSELTILMHSAWLVIERKSAQQQSALEREKYYAMLNELPALICEFLPDSTLTFVNKRYASYLGLPLESSRGKQHLEFMPEEQRRKQYQSLTPQNRTNEYTLEFVAEGKTRWEKWRDIGVFDKQGKPVYYYSIGFDITERMEAARERERLLEQLDAMVKGHQAVMLLIKPVSGEIIDANPAATAFYGYSKKELLNMCIQDINTLPKKKLKALRLQAAAKGQKYFTFSHRLKNGEIRTVDVFSSPIIYNDETVLFSIIFDVTKREEAFKEIVYLSFHDYLTGLYNRRFFEEEFLRLDMKKNYPIAVIMGDVNGLKLINDSLGHQEGDRILKEAAEKIKGCLRPNDILARVGGDEFAIIAPNTDESEARKIIRRIEKNMKRTEGKELGESLLSVSLGYAIKVKKAVKLDHLMKDAEGYLYARKYYDHRSLKGRTVNIIMNTLFEKSPREKMHSERVGEISAAIAKKMGLDVAHINRVRTAGFLHDIGKIGIPEHILNKNGDLNEQEWQEMKTHPERSWRILNNTLAFSEISNIVLCHHELWDGSGYPKGIKGEEIPLEARIIAISDAYDAMTNERSYRTRVSHEEAIKELIRCSGRHFDSEIVEVFLRKVLKYKKSFSAAGEDNPIHPNKTKQYV